MRAELFIKTARGRRPAAENREIQRDSPGAPDVTGEIRRILLRGETFLLVECSKRTDNALARKTLRKAKRTEEEIQSKGAQIYYVNET